MSKLNKKGFTLIELLAVVVIIGILMVVAIPNVIRYITNSRKDTMVSIAQEYANQFMNMWEAGYISCYRNNNNTELVQSNQLPADIGYYFAFSTQKGKTIIGGISHTAPSVNLYTNATALIKSGGKSPYNNRDLNGVIRINTKTTPPTVYIRVFDGKYGTVDPTNINGDVYSKMIDYTKLNRKYISETTNTGFTYYGGDCIVTD